MSGRLTGNLVEQLVGLHYTTQSGDSVMGIALRQLRNANRWREIVAANSEKYPDMGPHDYYPVATRLVLPSASYPSEMTPITATGDKQDA